MKNEMRNNRFLFFLSTLIATVMLASTSLADTPYWDTNWNYRKQVVITSNVATTLYDYSMEISFDTAELMSEGKMQNDCGDIRIVENGQEIDYGIRNPNSVSTEIYFIATDLNDGNNTDIYIYYGNPDSNNGFVENWKDAFYIWYDEFNTDRGWDNCPGNTRPGTVTVDNGWLYAQWNQYNDYHVCPNDGSSFPMDGRAGFKAETRIKAENDNLCQIAVMLGDSNSTGQIPIINFRVGHNDYQILWDDSVSKTLDDDVWYDAYAVYDRLTGDWYGEFADDGIVSGTRAAQPGDDFSTIMFDICNGINMYLDYLYLRYFIEPEPTYNFGEEESLWELLSGELNIPRSGLTGEALNGYVYAIGGVVKPSSPSDAQNAVSRYNTMSDTWYLDRSMPTARHSLSSGVIDGYMYAVGGHVANSRSENERWNGDPCETWQSRASVYARSGPGVAEYNGKLYVFGGNHYATILSRVDIYDPNTNTWSSGSDMPSATEPRRAVTLSGKIYVPCPSVDPNKIWCYDPNSDTWDTNIPAMNVPRSSYELQGACGRLYAIGGSNVSDGVLSSVESWAPGEESWQTEPYLNVARSGLASAVIGSDIYVFGGSDGNDLGSTELLRICTGPIKGDINNDCRVDFIDFAYVAAHWLEDNRE